MKGARTRRRGVLGKIAISCDLLRFRYQIQPGHRQHGRVQNLANVAGGFGTVIMRVKKREARGDV
jgi:hypothetical protein